MSKKKNNIPKLMQRATIDTNSINVDDRTFDVVFATEQPVYRRGWETDFYEVLVCDASSIRAQRLDAGAIPVVDTHGTYTIRNQFGTVVSWKIESKRCVATIKFTKRADAQGLWDDIENGIIKSVSVGYRTWKMMAMPLAQGEKVPTYRVVDWEPMELSLVPVPADFNAMIRSSDQDENEVEIITNSNLNIRKMDEETQNQEQGSEQQQNTVVPEQQQRSAEQPQPPAAPISKAPAQETQRTPAEIERTRCMDILTAGRAAGLDEKFIDNLLTRGISLETASREIFQEMAKNNPLNNTRNVSVNNDKETENNREGMILGLMSRAVPGSVDISKNEKAQNCRFDSLLELAKRSLQLKGERYEGISPSELVQRAIATTDYPNILGSVSERFLRSYYNTYVPEWKMFGRQVNAVDFREKTGVKVDGAVTFEELSEGGEYKETPIIQDETAKLRLKTFARQFSITRKAIINDDLDIFSRIPQIIAQGANQFQSTKFWNMIISNAKAPDGVALFHANHKNLAAGGGNVGAPDETMLNAARVAMRRQRSPAGSLLGLKPKFLLVPPELEMKADKIVSAIIASQTGDVNVFAGKLTVVVSDALTNPTEWYIVADPGISGVDGLVYSYLTGQEGLYTETYTDQKTDNVVTKARLDFDTSIWGWQTWYKNPGV